jgi:hypothetical protein
LSLQSDEICVNEICVKHSDMPITRALFIQFDPFKKPVFEAEVQRYRLSLFYLQCIPVVLVTERAAEMSYLRI